MSKSPRLFSCFGFEEVDVTSSNRRLLCQPSSLMTLNIPKDRQTIMNNFCRTHPFSRSRRGKTPARARQGQTIPQGTPLSAVQHNTRRSRGLPKEYRQKVLCLMKETPYCCGGGGKTRQGKRGGAAVSGEAGKGESRTETAISARSRDTICSASAAGNAPAVSYTTMARITATSVSGTIPFRTFPAIESGMAIS